MADITVTVEKIGLEDIEVGSGTFSRTTSTGGSQNIHKLNASNIPLVDSEGIWGEEYIEDALNALKAITRMYDKRTRYIYKDSGSFYLAPAMYHHYGTTEQIVYWTSTITKTVSGLSTYTWYYVYLDDSAIVSAGTNVISSSEILVSNQAPSFNGEKFGWYNGDDRCIFAFRTYGGGTPPRYFHDGGSLVLYGGESAADNGHILDFSNSSFNGDASDTLTIPAFSTLGRVYVHATSSTGAVTSICIGPSSSNVMLIGGVNSADVNRWHVDIPTASNQAIYIDLSDRSKAISLILYTIGYHLPAGM